jgi:hypothetical protein
MKRYFLSLLALFFVIQAGAQGFELEKVTKEQLMQKRHPNDTTASAAILFKKAHTTFNYTAKDGFSSKTEFSIKIKIYKTEGLKWANYEIPYYVGYEDINDEQVIIKKAYTYNLENGKIEKQKVSSESKFKEKVNELWETKTVVFPNVKEGSIIELKYEFKSNNLSELPVFQFQYKIPVDYAQLLTEIPGFYLYQAIKNGFVEVHLTDKLEDASLQYENKYQSTVSITYKQIKTMYEVIDVPALVEEDYVKNINDYYGKIVQELKTIQFPDEPVKQIASSWESVAKSIYEEKSFGGELNKKDYFLEDLKKITDKIDAKSERLKLIFEYVKNKMNWNKRYGYYTRNGVEKAYQESTGNVAEINLILTAMLKMGGLDANPVLISTRENGVALFPNRSTFNYVIASVQLDGKQYLLDATNKFCTINNLPLRDLNEKGRLINKDGSSEEIDLMPNYNSLYALNLIGSIDNQGGLKANIREVHSDYNALKFRDTYSGISRESYIEKLERNNPGLEINEYELKNDKLIYEPVIESYTISNKNAVELIGDKMFFSPMLYFAMTINPFKQETRLYPVDFSFPSKTKYNFIINIPDGYKVESLPKQLAIGIDEKYTAFSYIASNTDKQINLLVTFDINASVIPSQHYDGLKQFFKLMIEKQNEKIVLKKI